MRTRIIFALFIGVAVLLLTGCGSDGNAEPIGQASPSEQTTSSTPEPEPTTESTPEPTTEPPPPPPLPSLSKSDIRLDVKVKSKHCFGSAGCNITYTVIPTWVGLTPIHLDDDYDVTYSVVGGEDGPTIDTFEFYSRGRYEVPYEGIASTSSASKELTAKVTGVSPHLGY